MKQCVVPRCGYVGESKRFEPVFVPDKPYKPENMVVKCPECGRRSLFCELKEQLSEFEQQKRAYANEWELLSPFRPAVMERMGWRGVKHRDELRIEGPWKQWHEGERSEEGIIAVAVKD